RRHDPDAFEEGCRPLQAVPAEPAEQLLAAVSDEEGSDDDSEYQERDIHRSVHLLSSSIYGCFRKYPLRPRLNPVTQRPALLETDPDSDVPLACRTAPLVSGVLLQRVTATRPEWLTEPRCS